MKPQEHKWLGAQPNPSTIPRRLDLWKAQGNTWMGMDALDLSNQLHFEAGLTLSINDLYTTSGSFVSCPDEPFFSSYRSTLHERDTNRWTYYSRKAKSFRIRLQTLETQALAANESALAEIDQLLTQAELKLSEIAIGIRTTVQRAGSPTQEALLAKSPTETMAEPAAAIKKAIPAQQVRTIIGRVVTIEEARQIARTAAAAAERDREIERQNDARTQQLWDNLD